MSREDHIMPIKLNNEIDTLTEPKLDPLPANAQTFLKLLKEQRVRVYYSTGIVSLDSSLNGSKGFKSPGVYDISCCPGNVGKWELIFKLIITFLQKNGSDRECETNETDTKGKKVLIIRTLKNIPWFKLKQMKGYKDNFAESMDYLEIGSLSALIYLLKNDLSKYGLILIDFFSSLYQNCLLDMKQLIDIKKSEKLNNLRTNGQENQAIDGKSGGDYTTSRGPLKRDRDGNVINNPNKIMSLIIQDIMILLNSTSEKNGSIFITTGNMSSVGQKFYSNSSNSYIDQNENDYFSRMTPKLIKQQTLVPTMPLNGPWSSYFTNRIILYKDWIDKPLKVSGLQKNLTIPEYYSKLKNDLMVKKTHFLCIGIDNSSGQKIFNDGFFDFDESGIKSPIELIPASKKWKHSIKKSILNNLLEIPDSQPPEDENIII
ncbi:hypothetical protein B5S33_g5126 [[Candida] boidinii]|nr:hypothetical protein B5S30_g4571 [[Candida] boidinii]OWB86431.1 hypothetical protein B5S33_g5126 [[Candida] boidinii]GMF98478.1 unnamed protein product [[Candida] boidinii]